MAAMRRAFEGIGVVVFTWALTQGCGGGGGGPPEPVGEFSADYVAALCHRILACNSSEIAALDPTIVDQASCEAGLEPSSGSDLGLLPVSDRLSTRRTAIPQVELP